MAVEPLNRQRAACFTFQQPATYFPPGSLLDENAGSQLSLEINRERDEARFN